MNDVLKPYMRKFVLAFFDDKLIFFIDIHSHMQYLEHILEVVDQNQLKVNKKKCNSRIFRSCNIRRRVHNKS